MTAGPLVNSLFAVQGEQIGAGTQRCTKDLRWPPRRCPGCGDPGLLRSGDGSRLVCEECGRCWQDELGGAREIDSLACPGCDRRSVCESRPTWLVAEKTSRRQARDGTAVIVRPLLYSDRDELAHGFEALSVDSRRLRFLTAASHLSAEDLEYLTNLDYRDHFAWAAFAADMSGHPGIAVARYIRDPERADRAEAAVTVAEAYWGRGVGTLLLALLIEEAIGNGIRTFVAHVLWENRVVLEPLQELGAEISGEDSGVARVDVDLPELLEAAAGVTGVAIGSPSERILALLDRLAGLGRPGEREVRAPGAASSTTPAGGRRRGDGGGNGSGWGTRV